MDRIKRWLEDAPEYHQRTGRPLVTLAYAQTLDGCLTLHAGQPTALSGPKSAELTHRLRAAHQGILVGIGTVLADDPQLNVRLVEGKNPQPVILDTYLRIPATCRLMQRDHQLPWILTGHQADSARAEQLEKMGAKIIRVEASGGQIDLAQVLAMLANLGLETLMVEGGAGVITSFLTNQLINHAVVTVIPVWSGGFHLTGTELISQKRKFPVLLEPAFEPLGDDLVIWGKLGEKNI